MRTPRSVCRNANLPIGYAVKGAEAMLKAVREDVAYIMQTADTESVYNRLKTYFEL